MEVFGPVEVLIKRQVAGMGQDKTICNIKGFIGTDAGWHRVQIVQPQPERDQQNQDQEYSVKSVRGTQSVPVPCEYGPFNSTIFWGSGLL